MALRLNPHQRETPISQKYDFRRGLTQPAKDHGTNVFRGARSLTKVYFFKCSDSDSLMGIPKIIGSKPFSEKTELYQSTELFK